MKQFLLLLIVLTTSTTLFSQNSNLVFFTQNGERFYVILNGVKQNAKAETNVKVTDLSQPYYKAKIIFEEPALGEVDKTINFNPGMETVIAVKKNKKEEYVMRWQSEVPVAQAPPPAPTQSVIVYSTTPPPVADITVIETTTTVTESTAPTGEHVSVGINAGDAMGGVNMNINMNISEGTSTTGTTTSTTHSTTTVSSSSSGGTVAHPAQPAEYVLPGYNGPTGCDWPLNETDFAAMKQSISSKSFEDSKLTVAKQIAGANCLLCEQVKQIMQLFDFEDSKLDFAKYVHGYTFDQGNFYKLNDAFDFESSIDELNQYINSH